MGIHYGNDVEVVCDGLIGGYVRGRFGKLHFFGGKVPHQTGSEHLIVVREIRPALECWSNRLISKFFPCFSIPFPGQKRPA